MLLVFKGLYFIKVLANFGHRRLLALAACNYPAVVVGHGAMEGGHWEDGIELFCAVLLSFWASGGSVGTIVQFES